MVIVYVSIVVLVLFTFIFVSAKWLVKNSSNTFKELDALKTQCLEIKNKEDFQECLDEFNRLLKISFHKHHYMELHEIYGILKTKTYDHANNNATNA